MKKTIILFSLLLGLLGSMYASASGGEEGYNETIQKLDAAVEDRDYRSAKELITELIPLIKEDIKASKKTLSEAKKSGEDEQVMKQMKTRLDGKKGILEKFDHLVNTSPAAIRVRASEIQTLVVELEELITN